MLSLQDLLRVDGKDTKDKPSRSKKTVCRECAPKYWQAGSFEQYQTHDHKLCCHRHQRSESTIFNSAQFEDSSDLSGMSVNSSSNGPLSSERGGILQNRTGLQGVQRPSSPLLSSIQSQLSSDSDSIVLNKAHKMT